MAEQIDMSKARKIAPTYDNRGNPSWKSRMSPPDDTFALCMMVPDRIVPVIFVPGVMGSNLKGVGKAKGVSWTLNSNASMVPWLGRGAEKRKETLTPPTMEVDDGGDVPEGTQQTAEELKRRKWGEVGALSYAEFLVWLENALNDYNDAQAGERVKLMRESLQALAGEALLSHDEVRLSYRYRMPVHACGYNWLASNAESAARLGQRIDEVIARYRTERKKCEKVILVTHSMGGLVARHCSEVLGYRDKILGIVHGVMPAIGAAAVYRRFKAGTEGPYLASEVLGNDAAEMTAVLSSAPGPLQLLPTPEYGNGWLKIRDRHTTVSLPLNGDPYGEIYAVRGQWWSMCDDQLINPLNKETDPKRRQARMDADWDAFADTIYEQVRRFHLGIQGKYHPTTHAFFGSHPTVKAYGTVTWLAGGDRGYQGPSDFMHGTQADPGEIDTTRTVTVQTATASAGRGGGGAMTQRTEFRRFGLSQPDEPGDGTVPHRSGIAPQQHCQGFMQVKVEHEPAYKASKGADNLRACRFTLRSIVKIVQGVRDTSLMYEELR